MRFKLTLTVDERAFGNILPLNYQYEQSAVIYRILSYAGGEFSTWLHNNGFTLGNKKFKLFTFSRLIVPQYGIDTQRQVMRIQSKTVEWMISFLPEIATEKFITGVFKNQTFQLGNKNYVVQFRIKEIKILPEPVFREDGMEFRSLSPVCISRRTPDLKIKYLSPEDPIAKTAFLQSLLNRYEAFYGQPYPLPPGEINYDLKILTPPKPVLITIKAGLPEETKIRGYLCNFRVIAPAPLLKILYNSGAGEKGSLGFGCVEGE